MRNIRQYKFLYFCLAVYLLSYCLPEPITIPVAGASARDWNPQSFWFEPWGKSGVHKGIDIFGKKGTPVLSTTNGIVLYTGQIGMGGNVVVVLGVKWRLHYFAHLDSISTSVGAWLRTGEVIATVGDSGNAKGKAPHLHYAIMRMLPVPWMADGSTQGYKKVFYINPHAYLLQLPS